MKARYARFISVLVVLAFLIGCSGSGGMEGPVRRWERSRT